jgi:hypothetical protein
LPIDTEFHSKKSEAEKGDEHPLLPHFSFLLLPFERAWHAGDALSADIR